MGEPASPGAAHVAAASGARGGIRHGLSNLWQADWLTLESTRFADILAASAVVIGFWLRWKIAAGTYLNPDEAIFYFAATADGHGLLDNIVRSQHAPLPILLLHFIEKINSSELALRLAPLLAGSLFPWVVYRWLGATWNRTAGLIGLVALTFSPALVSLSAQARGYTLVLFFAALALRWLDSGLAARSATRVLASAGCTALAILTEFSGTYFAAGAAAYFLVRLLFDRLPKRLIIAWALGQAAVAVVTVVLYQQIAAPLLTDATYRSDIIQVFGGAYLQPGDNFLVFLAAGTVRQFSFLFGSHLAGAVAMPFFAVAIVGLCLRKRYALAVLLMAPLVVAWIGAALIHPFGRSRHTSILALTIAPAVAIGIDMILRRRAALAIPALAVLLPVTGWPDVNDIAPSRHHRESMIAAIQYLRSTVPPDGVLFTDRETGLLLHYYLRDEQHSLPNWQLLREVHFGDLHMVANRSWDFGNTQTFTADLDWLRQLLGDASRKPIWIADGGFTTTLRRDLLRQSPHLTLPDLRTFDGAVEVFKLPPDFR
jgi:dolichyl-phosphate-mannose-protein mannosyltransferase